MGEMDFTNAAPTFTLRARLGSVTGATVFSMNASACRAVASTHQPWFLDAWLYLTAVGAGGTFKVCVYVVTSEVPVEASYPYLHLARRQDGGIFDQLAVRHVEGVWEAARPVWE